jgi:ribosomal protein L9
LQPDAATNIISKLLPANIDFYRTPIATEQHKSQPPKRLSPSIPAASAISAAAAEGQPKEVEAKEPGKTSIYGSVSTSDIAANIKAVLAENNEGARVVLSSEHISFVEEMEDQDRVKHLGVFEIDIRLPGAANAVRRTITVSAQE